MSYRGFPPHIEAAADEAASKVITDEPWVVIGAHTPTATCAVRVSMQVSGLTAWAKPGRPCVNDKIYAAHEKIAADLAYKLRLPVPPVCLSRPPSGTTGFPEIVALSYEPFPQTRLWRERAGLLTPDRINILKPAASAMMVFHTWIMDKDHNGNDGNVVIDVLPNPPQPVIGYIDHSYSLSYNNPLPTPQPMAANGLFHNEFSPIDQGAVSDMVSKINALSESEICDIIGRVSGATLPLDLGTRLSQFLCDRRPLLHQIFNT